MNNGIFNGMFDFDHDGELNAFEYAAEFQFLDEISTENELSDADYDSDFSDDFDF